MAHWIGGNLAGLDLETDSPQPDEAHLITAALVPRGRDPYAWVSRPRRPIPDEAAAVHGYTTERAGEVGRFPDQVLAEIFEALEEHWTPDCPLVVYNAPFDLTILDREFGRVLNEWLEIGDRCVIDPFLIDKQADKYRPGDRKLEITAAHYGVTLDAAAHDATVDVLAAMRLAYKLGQRQRWPRGQYGPSEGEIEARRILRDGDLRELHQAQARWFREQYFGLAAYFRTPKAIAKIERDFAAGKTTREQADALRDSLGERADDVERHADQWPVRVRDSISVPT